MHRVEKDLKVRRFFLGAIGFVSWGKYFKVKKIFCRAYERKRKANS
jgi:hypothetical protein